MKVKDVIKYSADLHKKDCSDAAAEIVERLGLDVEKKVDDLSLGNRKKAGIVCALQHRPELIIMDEPTSGLDPLMQHEFFNILTEQHEKGATVFLSSHILSEVQTHCRTAAFIKDGRIIMADRVDKLEKTGAKKVTLRGRLSEDFKAGLADMADEVSDKVIEEKFASFLYSGDIVKLLTMLADEKPKDVTITEPTMEEIFMNYYE